MFIILLLIVDCIEGFINERIVRIVKNAFTFEPTSFDLREAEIKHGRIAMLAAVGWPISELQHYQLANTFGLKDLLQTTDGKAPSVLNGGLDNFPSLFALGIFFSVGAVLEYENLRRKYTPEPLENFYDMWREEDFDEPGNFGFDPLDFKNKITKTQEDKVKMQKIEIFNGRVSMLATVGYVVQEIVTGLPVVSETPQFFKPIFDL